MSKSKQGKVINEARRALDTALSEGVISKDTYARLNVPGLKAKKPAFDLESILDAPPPPEPELMPEPEPVPEPAPEPIPDTEYRDAVVTDDVANGFSCTATPEDVSGTAPAASSPDEVGPSSHDEPAAVANSDITSFQETGPTAKEKEMGFAFTLCFKCGRVDIAQYADQYLPEEVRGDCEADNGIVMTLCGLCKRTKGGDNKIGSLCSAFKELGMSAEILEGSTVHKIASTVLSQEVAFIMDGGNVAYRDINTIVTSLGRGDKLMSVDVERFKRGKRTGLILPYLEGGLIPSVEGEKIGKVEDDTWGAPKYNNRLFGNMR